MRNLSAANDRVTTGRPITNHKIKNILFDLDGTLTDPAEGITKSLQHALGGLGLPVPAQADLRSYIGPPLRHTFASFLSCNQGHLIEQGVALYRERFSTVGLYENEIYPGIAAALYELNSLSFRLFLATSKVAMFAEKILQHFQIDHHFEGVYGSHLDGRFDDKGDLLEHLLKEKQLLPSETVMIGDRKHDIIAAKRHGLLSIGVTYGFGSLEELQSAGADVLCDAPGEILNSLDRSRFERSV